MFLRLFKATGRNAFIAAVPRNRIDELASGRHFGMRAPGSVAIYTCDAAGLITYYNNQAAELWGCKPALGDTDEKFCGSHMRYRVDGGELPYDQCPMADVLAGKVGGIFDGEVHVQRPDGSRVMVIVNISPLIDENGVIVGAVNSFHANRPLNPVNGAWT